MGYEVGQDFSLHIFLSLSHLEKECITYFKRIMN